MGQITSKSIVYSTIVLVYIEDYRTKSLQHPDVILHYHGMDMEVFK